MNTTATTSDLPAHWHPKRRELELLAAAAAYEWQYRVGDSLPELVRRLGGRIRYVNIFRVEANVQTLTVWGPRDFTILLSDYTSPRRDNFTIAHELGRYYVESQQGAIPMQCSRAKVDTRVIMANQFAASLLMPAEHFRREHTARPTASWLAYAFDVSEKVSKTRAIELGLQLDCAWAHKTQRAR